jgi:hypothetical protein
MRSLVVFVPATPTSLDRFSRTRRAADDTLQLTRAIYQISVER